MTVHNPPASNMPDIPAFLDRREKETPPVTEPAGSASSPIILQSSTGTAPTMSYGGEWDGSGRSAMRQHDKRIPAGTALILERLQEGQLPRQVVASVGCSYDDVVQVIRDWGGLNAIKRAPKGRPGRRIPDVA